MAYRYGDRTQQTLFPRSIGEYIGEDDVVRAYDALIDAMDLKSLGIVLSEARVGNSSYDPVSMLKLLVYGYSYGVRSSRKLERECHYNVSFMWLMGGLTPDHKTIAEFRRKHSVVLKRTLKQSAQIALKLGLIEGNTLFVDGSKIRGNASIRNSWTANKCKEALKRLDSRIEKILNECEEVDTSEKHLGSLVKLEGELKNAQKLKSKIEGIIEELRETERASLNTVDRDCVRCHGTQGSYAGYNMQSVVDEKQGLIVQADVVSQSNDYNQLSPQLEEAHKTLGKQCEQVCADSGYSSIDDLEQVDKAGVYVIVPSSQQASHKEPREFDRTKFRYDEKSDSYICPEGEQLRCVKRERKESRYRAAGAACMECQYFGICTKSKNGRTIRRSVKEDLRERLENQYSESQEVYRLRKQKVELPFAHLKKNLKLDSFLLRGTAGVNAEASILATCFNAARMITCLGVSNFITAVGP